MRNKNLEQRIAVLTGASSGIGEAVLRDLSFHRVRTVANARGAERLDALAAELNGEERLVEAVAGDAGMGETVTRIASAATEKFGRDADLWIVNAGRGLPGSIVTSDAAQWEELFRLNINGALLLMREAASRLLKQVEAEGPLSRPRDIIVIGSCVGRNVIPRGAVYSATKFAVNASAEALRREICGSGIRVTLVEPGLVRTEFHTSASYGDDFYEKVSDSMGPLIDGEDVARAVNFVASQPPHVHVSDIVVRSVRQDYP